MKPEGSSSNLHEYS